MFSLNVMFMVILPLLEDLHIKLSTADSAGGGRSGSGAVSERTS